MPFGFLYSAIDELRLKKAFSKKLVLLLGELDNAEETRGTMLHTPQIDRHGLGRFERGNYFFNQARSTAEGLGAGFQWKIEIVPQVGHDYRKMASAAANLLYGRP